MEPVLVSSPPLDILFHEQKPESDPVVMVSSLTREISQAADSYTDSNMTFSVNLSPNVVLDRTVMIEYDLTVRIRGPTAGPATIDVSGSDVCLRSFPLNAVCKSCTVTINNNSKTLQNHQLVAPLSLYHNNFYNEYDNYACPCTPDATNNVYAAGRPTAAASADPATILIQRQTAPALGNSQFLHFANKGVNGDRLTRGCFYPKSAGVWDTNGVELKYTIREPLLHNFFSGMLERGALCNVSNLRIDLVLNNLKSMLQVANTMGSTGQIGASLEYNSVTFSSKPRLLLRTYAPSQSIPKRVEHNYSEIITRNFTVGTVNVGSSGDFSSGQITLPNVPDKILVFLRQSGDIGSVADKIGKEADAFGVIQSLTLRTDSDQGSLSAASPAQLYQMCKRNNLVHTWNEFNNLVGSVVMIDLNNSDIGGYVPSTNTPFTFDVKGTFLNTTYDGWDAYGNRTVIAGGAGTTAAGCTLNWDLFVVSLHSGKLVCGDNQCEIVLGMSASAVASAVNKGVQGTFDEKSLKEGAGFWRDFKKGFKKGWKTGTKILDAAAPIASVVAPEFKPAIDMAQKGNAALRSLTGQGYRVTG